MPSDLYKKYGRKYYQANKQKVIERNNITKAKARSRWQTFKATLKCNRCGENHPATLDFHHIDSSDPTNRKVHKLMSNGRYRDAMEEIKKCEVLCANCHRKHHYDELQARLKILTEENPPE
jgi:hypothetical protein